MAPLTQQASHLVLNEADAARVWNWVLARQGLAEGQQLGSAVEIADATLGLHAARLPSPYAIVAARTSDPAVPGSLFTERVRSSLLTVRCMRKTLHALPLHLAGAAHTATLRFRDRDAQRAVHNAGYGAGIITSLITEITAILGDGPLPYREIETLLTATGAEVRAARLAIKVAWERGVIAYINATDSWNREARTFALTKSSYPGLDLSLTRDQAMTTLISAYFNRYGPASIRDSTWWSGLSATDITNALQRSGRPVISVRTPWSANPCLMFADQAADALSSRAVAGVQLLAHEDSALKAYYETRGRYLANLPQRKAFNQIGEALPTITVNGIVTGTWAWDSHRRSVSIRTLPGSASPAVHREIRGRAAALTHTLRAGLTASSRRDGRNQVNQPTSGTAVHYSHLPRRSNRTRKVTTWSR